MRKALIVVALAGGIATSVQAQSGNPGGALNQALDQYCSDWLKAADAGEVAGIQAQAMKAGWAKLNTSNPKARSQRLVAPWGQMDLRLDTGSDDDTRVCTINIALEPANLSWNQAYSILGAWAAKAKPTAVKTDDQRVSAGSKRTAWSVDGNRVVTLVEPDPRVAIPQAASMITVWR